MEKKWQLIKMLITHAMPFLYTLKSKETTAEWLALIVNLPLAATFDSSFFMGPISFKSALKISSLWYCSFCRF